MSILAMASILLAYYPPLLCMPSMPAPGSISQQPLLLLLPHVYVRTSGHVHTLPHASQGQL